MPLTRSLLAAPVKAIALIGCGGTGSILAEHLARMIRGHRLEISLALWDGDAVSESNVLRQNFTPEEIGQNKASALALRLAGQLGLPISAGQTNWSTGDYFVGELIVTATDSLTSRRLVAKASHAADRRLWLDVGNELAHGQAILGTTHEPARLAAAWHGFDRAAYASDLPDRAAVEPALLGRRIREGRLAPSCADVPFEQQAAGVNAAAALAALMILRPLLLERSCPLAAVYFDLARGQMLPRRITRDWFAPWKGHKPAKPEDRCHQYLEMDHDGEEDDE